MYLYTHTDIYICSTNTHICSTKSYLIIIWRNLHFLKKFYRNYQEYRNYQLKRLFLRIKKFRPSFITDKFLLSLKYVFHPPFLSLSHFIRSWGRIFWKILSQLPLMSQEMIYSCFHASTHGQKCYICRYLKFLWIW